MSTLMQKLRKDLDQAKAKQSTAIAATPHVAVGFDVIELLYAALVAQDIELKKLRGQQSTTESATGAATSTVAHDTDAYLGHTENPADAAVYHMKKPKIHAPAVEADDAESPVI